MAPARTAALEVLRRVGGGATLAEALVRERDGLPDARDRALTTEIATGTLRWRGAIDRVIGEASGRPLSKIDPAVLDVLRLSAYQLLHLDRLPPRAIVHDAVDLVRRGGHASAAGFVNAVLRRVASSRGTSLATPPPPGGEALVAHLSASGSHPAWLVARWLERFGPDATRRWMAFNNAPAPLALRVNRLKGTRDDLQKRLAAEGVSGRPTEWAAHGLIVASGNPIGGASASAGLFVVQDEASQIVGELAAAWAGGTVLDACAAPGGKTLALLEAKAPSGLVVGADRRPRRLRLLRETLQRIASSRVPLVQIDLSRPLPFRDAFDLVVVDAPCSGLGTVRREPDLKWRRAEADLEVFSAVQHRMLESAARAVAPGGRVIYATCSSEPDENDAVVARFLERHPRFSLGGPDARYPPGLALLVEPGGMLRTSPDRHGLEAFFAAVLERAP